MSFAFWLDRLKAMDNGWTSCLPEFAYKKRNKLRQATDHLDSVKQAYCVKCP
ncbi:hypothetical protein BPJM79_20177 [Bacillus pumilus]